jgi:anthranilate phosphoribosyltransferase
MLRDVLRQFEAGRDLEIEGAEECFDALIRETDEPLLAKLLLAWNAKGTTADEIYALARVMRLRAVKIKSKHETFADTVGTGGSKAKTFNVSTAAAFVIAGAGVPVAKHGNRAASSNSGSADVLSELGVNPAVNPQIAEACLNKIGICFMFAPNYHSLSPVLAKVRRSLGQPTIFNNLGPLCNPADAPHQVIGVWNGDLVQKTAEVLSRLGTKRSWVVHGSDGLDEITLLGKTLVAEIINGSVNTFEIEPADFGLRAQELNGLHVTSPGESAGFVNGVLDGSLNGEAATDIVLINAAAAIYVAGFASTLCEAFNSAKESVRSNSAINKLNELRSATNKSK